MLKKYILHHDHKLSFFVVFITIGIGLTLLFNLSVLIILIIGHTILDFMKYRLHHCSRLLSLGKALQDQLIDMMFVFISVTLAVYLHHKTPGIVGLYGIRALEEIRMFEFVKAIPRFALIENLVKGVAHTAEHFRHHATRFQIPRFGDWQSFGLQMIIYCVILIVIAPAFTALTYADVWHIILIEVSPWHIGAH